MLAGTPLQPPVRLVLEPENAEHQWTGAPLSFMLRAGRFRVRALGSHFGSGEFDGSTPARVRLAVVSLSPYLEELPTGAYRPTELVFDATLTGDTETDALTWREGQTVKNIVTIEAGDLAGAAQRTWAELGHHRAPTDPVLDRGVVLVGAETPSAKVERALDALASAQRTVERKGQLVTVQALSLRVARASEAVATPEFDPMTLPAPPKSLRARFGKASVNGRVDRDVFRADMEALLPRFERCLSDALARKKPPSTIEIRFVVGADGRPSLVSFPQHAGGQPDATLARCQANAVLFLKTARPKGGIVTVVYPLLWSAQ